MWYGSRQRAKGRITMITIETVLMNPLENQFDTPNLTTTTLNFILSSTMMMLTKMSQKIVSSRECFKTVKTSDEVVPSDPAPSIMSCNVEGEIMSIITECS